MSELQNLAEMNMLDASKCEFDPTDGGYISLKYEDKTYERIKICRALPYKAPDEYICITDRDGNEIGILRDLKLLSEENQAHVKAELTKIYYCPSFTKIMTVKDRMGYQYFEVQTNAGKREFALRDASRNIRYVNPEKRGAVQIRDIDGNRYLIDDFDEFDTQSRKKIEAFLV
ncbi:MAG: DUF1854 domain-containing protein [Clostridia bacterium]|nr:DUF1854 domain-containing protein [Clostridia bacterium]